VRLPFRHTGNAVAPHFRKRFWPAQASHSPLERELSSTRSSDECNRDAGR